MVLELATAIPAVIWSVYNQLVETIGFPNSSQCAFGKYTQKRSGAFITSPNFLILMQSDLVANYELCQGQI